MSGDHRIIMILRFMRRRRRRRRIRRMVRIVMMINMILRSVEVESDGSYGARSSDGGLHVAEFLVLLDHLLQHLTDQ